MEQIEQTGIDVNQIFLIFSQVTGKPDQYQGVRKLSIYIESSS